MGAYTPGERVVQERAGVRQAADRSARAIRDDIPDVAAEFLARQPFVVAGARDAAGRMWASLFTGAPGFARALDERTVELGADLPPGDPLSDLPGGTPLGLLAIEPASRRRMRLNGRVRLRAEGGLSVSIDQVVANCPKYITERHRAAAVAPAGRERTEGDRLGDRQRAWIATADTLFLATADRDGADASHRGGAPGFVDVVGDDRLVWPDYAGNAMFLSLGNLESDPKAGLLFIDWERGSTLQLTGQAEVDWRPGMAERFPGAERVVTFELDRWVQLDGATAWRWRFGSYSRFNPPAPPARHDGS